MTIAARSARQAANPQTAPSNADLKALVWPIVKRLPAYVRLGWAILRDPAIPRRHKALLYSAIVYTVTPLHLLASPIPVVGQLDSVVLLLLGIRQALAHCPPEAPARHLSRLKLSPRQVDRDLHVTVYVSWLALGRVGRPMRRNARFAGRVVSGFGRRMARRLIPGGTTHT